MAADVVKRAQGSVFIAHDQNWFASEFRGQVTAFSCDLLGATNQLPGAGEYLFFLEVSDGGIVIPGIWNSAGAFQR